MRRIVFFAGIVVSALFLTVEAQTKHADGSKYMTYKGLVMAGYQGWFNCEGDGAGRGWTHYRKGGGILNSNSRNRSTKGLCWVKFSRCTVIS